MYFLFMNKLNLFQGERLTASEEQLELFKKYPDFPYLRGEGGNKQSLSRETNKHVNLMVVITEWLRNTKTNGS